MTARVGDRRKGREAALQMLFQLDMAPQDTEAALETFWRDSGATEAVRLFASRIVRGAMEHRNVIDEVLTATVHHWRLNRIAVVDRNILRLAICEFLIEPETPPIVVIDEAIEIAKKFGNDDSGLFVNGILDAIRVKLENHELSLPAGLTPGEPTRKTR
jgi:N utilization substance protein B